MQRRKRKSRWMRRWAKRGLLLFACFLLYQGGFFLKEVVEKIVPAKQAYEMETTEYPDSVGSGIVYYNQEDPRWGKEKYGPADQIRDTGCGPTVLAMAVSSFTENKLNPKEMCDWAYENGYCSIGSGSYHTLMADGLDHFGIENTVTNRRDEVKAALQKGKPVIALMGEGHFTSGGHFILLCEMDEDGQVVVADPKSAARTNRTWKFEIIAEEAKMSPVAGGAFWILEV